MERPVKVQIYTMQSAAEAEAVAAVGVHHIGVTPAEAGLPGEVSLEVAAGICSAMSAVATTSALTVDVDLDTIVAMVRTVQPDILHLCGPPGAVSPADVARLRRSVPGVAIMQAIAVTGPDAVAVARSYEAVVEFLLLDSVDPAIPGVGAAGTVHDWGVSAAIVAAVDVPVILAGGLSPENVASAIATVQPWGVDSLTHTNRPLDGGGFRKDLDAVNRFVAAAHRSAGP